MPIPIYYRKSAEGATASYDWFDFASNVGYKRFYAAGATHASAAKVYFLTTTSGMNSDFENCGYDGNSADIDFDITFNMPIILAASNVYVNVSTRSQNAATTSHFHITVYHVTGVTETSLGTIESSTITQGGAGSAYYRRAVVVPITEKHFKKGDKLRINLVWTCSNGGYVYFDPASSLSLTEATTGRTIGTNLTVDVPIKIDL
jgi:hypothetical protein